MTSLVYPFYMLVTGSVFAAVSEEGQQVLNQSPTSQINSSALLLPEVVLLIIPMIMPIPLTMSNNNQHASYDITVTSHKPQDVFPNPKASLQDSFACLVVISS